MKFIIPMITALSVSLLSACNKAPEQPEIIDLKVAAQTWNTPTKTWSEPELHILEEGRRLYQRNCSACHSSTGGGQQSFGAPALKGSAVIKGPADTLITLVLDGRNGMPAFRTSLDAPGLAAILTYVRNAWGNDLGEIIETATVASSMPSAEHPGQGDKGIKND